ncbi:MAG: PorT family protein [Bacteroidales bacterium]|nr:PorT family protein [Bacteroidales bacterium]
MLTLQVAGQIKRVQNDPGYDYKWIHFGFMVGLNTMDFGFNRPAMGPDSVLFADVSKPNPGFQVSIVSDLRLGDRLSLRFLPGITFGSRSLYFYSDSGDTIQTLESKQSVESNYLDFPLLLKYKSRRVNNYRPYLVGGINMRYDMAARKDYDADGPYVRLTPMDFYAELGFGIDFFLQYFKFSPELKVSVGFRDVLVHEPAGGQNRRYANSIDGLKSYLVMLCFYFE